MTENQRIRDDNLTRRSLGLRKLTLLLLSMLTIMAAGIIAPSMPAIAIEFDDIPNAALLAKLMLSLPALFIAISAPFAGKYIDKRGRLLLLNFGIILYALAGTSGYYLHNLYLILLGRAFLGISIGIIMTVTMTLIGDYFEGEERRNFIGYQSAFIGIAGVVFLLGGGLLSGFNWRFPFLIYLFPVLLIPLVISYLEEPEIFQNEIKVNKLKVSPLINLLWINGLFIMILMYIIPTQLPFFLQSIGVTENFTFGAALATHAAGMVVSSLIYSRVKSTFSFPKIFVLGFLIMGSSYFFTILTTNISFVLAMAFAGGFGFGFLIANSNFWVIEITKPAVRGRVMGILTTYFFLGQFLSPLITEPLVRTANLSSVFTSSAIFMLVLAFVFYGLSDRLNTKSKSLQQL